MIVGLDTDGKVYLSLVQANSNSQMMELYFTTLIKLLDEKDSSWRSKMIILQDNAPYKTSKEIMAFYERQRLPIIFTGPHSYAASPIETWFSHFKRGNLNPEDLATGKTNFQNVVQIAVEKAKSIPVSHRILYWHNCLKHLYGYLLH